MHYKKHKEEPVEVHVGHTILGVWEIVSSSHEYIRKSSNDIEFVVNVPADGEEKVCF